MKMINRIAVCSLLLIGLAVSTAQAHKINVFASVEKGEVIVESYFADGRPVMESRVMVFDSNENQLLETRTDREGMARFPIPKVDRLEIVVREILGHRSSFMLEKAEVEAGLEAKD
ncbi:MAG: hypothetical protein C0615_04515 [Desulfuromonas sp.]|nr:MAG: hypothetical protein C0615_04515 [Desulfuromonas sp.]